MAASQNRGRNFVANEEKASILDVERRVRCKSMALRISSGLYERKGSRGRRCSSLTRGGRTPPIIAFSALLQLSDPKAKGGKALGLSSRR